MMGQPDRSEALFYYFRLEDQVPETHLLRLIEKHISFAFVRERLKQSYSETGRPSIDPELLLCILLIGYLYGSLRSIPGLHGEERQAIEDAIHKLRVLEREDANDTAGEQRKAAEAVLERLRSIAPKIKRPNEG